MYLAQPNWEHRAVDGHTPRWLQAMCDAVTGVFLAQRGIPVFQQPHLKQFKELEFCVAKLGFKSFQLIAELAIWIRKIWNLNKTKV
jgi:hypothetical protein